MRPSSRTSSFALTGLALLVAACSAGPQRPRPSESASSMRGLGCPDDTECPDDMRCVSFTTPDGRTGNACEDPCQDDSECPAGLACKAIASRPSKVCR